jgi:hypothetical protein
MTSQADRNREIDHGRLGIAHENQAYLRYLDSQHEAIALSSVDLADRLTTLLLNLLCHDVTTRHLWSMAISFTNELRVYSVQRWNSETTSRRVAESTNSTFWWIRRRSILMQCVLLSSGLRKCRRTSACAFSLLSCTQSEISWSAGSGFLSGYHTLGCM